MKKVILCMSIVVAASFFVFIVGRGDSLLHVSLLNVGQGDAIFIRSSDGENIIIDGGPDQKVITELADVVPFFDRTFDYAILTHPDKDHIAGLLNVLKRYPVKHILFTGAYKKDYYSEAFAQIIKEKNIPIIIADEKSDIFLKDGTIIDVLFPFTQDVGLKTDTNETSIVLKVIYGKTGMLFMGDAEAKTEEKLIAHGADVRADLIKIGHHGSKNGTTENFLKTVSPTASFISVGRNNGYKHPHTELLKRLQKTGQKIFRTDFNGRIEIIFSKEKIERINTQTNQ